MFLSKDKYPRSHCFGGHVNPATVPGLYLEFYLVCEVIV